MSVNKEYLGDSVYVDCDGFAFILTTENGLGASNTIVMEPNMVADLSAYVERMKNGGYKNES